MPSGYVVSPAGADLAGVAEVYAARGFRADLVTDLALVVALGGSVFTAAQDGSVVGVSSAFPFVGTGWVGGVAVLEGHGRRGLGEELTRTAVEALHDAGAATVLLHATAMAAPLYTRMGFTPEAEFVELVGDPLPSEAAGGPLRPGTVDDLAAVLDLDARVTGEDRSALLQALWPGEGRVHDSGKVNGFHLPQVASAAGAVLAEDPAAGAALLLGALSGRSAPARVPVPGVRRDVLELLGRHGYREHLRTTRMRLGPAVPFDAGGLVSAFNLYWG